MRFPLPEMFNYRKHVSGCRERKDWIVGRMGGAAGRSVEPEAIHDHSNDHSTACFAALGKTDSLHANSSP
jgi:hypothetical protein